MLYCCREVTKIMNIEAGKLSKEKEKEKVDLVIIEDFKPLADMWGDLAKESGK